MQKAAELLRQTQAPIGDIALAVGYRKYTNFLENFKQAYPTTPDAFRRQGNRLRKSCGIFISDCAWNEDGA